MNKNETVQVVRSSFFIARLQDQAQSVERIEQFWGHDGIRVDYAGDSELYIARDKRWWHLDHVRKEIQPADDEEMPFSPRQDRIDVQRLLSFIQTLLHQTGVKTTAPKQWSGHYFGVSGAFTELRSVNGDLCFQFVLGTVHGWRIPLRMVLITSDKDIFVRDTLSVRKQPVSVELFALPRDYKMVR